MALGQQRGDEMALGQHRGNVAEVEVGVEVPTHGILVGFATFFENTREVSVCRTIGPDYPA